MVFYLAPVLAFIAVLALIPPARALALRTSLVDEPGGRKRHEGQIPLIGGLVVFPVFMVLALAGGASFAGYWPLFAGIILLLATGAVDDMFGIRPLIKFTMQCAAAVLIVFAGGAQVFHLGDFFGFGVAGLGVFSIPFSLFCVVLLVNAMNFIDGLDGLAGGKGFVALAWLMAACAPAGQWQSFLVIAILGAALAGFLVYNMRHPLRSRASVFLGDAGSMALGLALAWFCIALAQGPDPALAPVSVAWIIALPVMDVCGQFFRRMKEGRHPFSPDRGHFHHHFIDAGFSSGQSTALILLIGALLGGIGYGGILIGIPEAVLGIGWIALLAGHIALSLRPQPFSKLLEKFTGSGKPH